MKASKFVWVWSPMLASSKWGEGKGSVSSCKEFGHGSGFCGGDKADIILMDWMDLLTRHGVKQSHGDEATP